MKDSDLTLNRPMSASGPLARRHLRENTIDRWHANQAAHECHGAQQRKVVAVRCWLSQIILGLLRHQRGHIVVKVEQHSEERRWHKCSCYVHTWHICHTLRTRHAQECGSNQVNICCFITEATDICSKELNAAIAVMPHKCHSDYTYGYQQILAIKAYRGSGFDTCRGCRGPSA